MEIIQGGHPELWDVIAVVECAVKNAGEVAGAEVAQLYVGIPSGNSDDGEEESCNSVGSQRIDMVLKDVETSEELTGFKFDIYL